MQELPTGSAVFALTGIIPLSTAFASMTIHKRAIATFCSSVPSGKTGMVLPFGPWSMNSKTAARNRKSHPLCGRICRAGYGSRGSEGPKPGHFCIGHLHRGRTGSFCRAKNLRQGVCLHPECGQSGAYCGNLSPKTNGAGLSRIRDTLGEQGRRNPQLQPGHHPPKGGNRTP